MRVRLSRAATRDIEDAWIYTAEHGSPDQAGALLDAFHDAFRLIERFPDSGRQRDELSPGLRSTATRGFVILYQVLGGVLEIVRVVHGARDLKGLTSDEDLPR